MQGPSSLSLITGKSNQSIALPTEPQCFVDAAWILVTQFGGFGWIFKDPISGESRFMSSNRSHVGSLLLLQKLMRSKLLSHMQCRHGLVDHYLQTQKPSSQFCLRKTNLSTSKTFFMIFISSIDLYFYLL